MPQSQSGNLINVFPRMKASISFCRLKAHLRGIRTNAKTSRFIASQNQYIMSGTVRASFCNENCNLLGKSQEKRGMRLMTVTTKVLAKGVSFYFAKKYIEDKYGKETWQQIMQSLPAAERDVWNGALLIGSEYPFAAFKKMTVALAEVLKTEKEAEIAAIYEYIADQSLNKIYKIFFRLAQPSFVIKNYPSLWSRFFNAGTVEVPVIEKGRAVVRFLLPDVFDDWLPPACLGYSKKAVAMGGGSDLTIRRIRYEKKSNDLFESFYELNWKA